MPAMVEIIPGTQVGVKDGVLDAVGVIDPEFVGVVLPPLCGQPPAGKGAPAGLALASMLGSAALTNRPLAITLTAVVFVTLVYKKQLASPKRSSVRAKA